METPEIDKELEEVETRIDQTRALYEQYFMGMERIEPQKPRIEIERRLKVLRKEQIRNTAQRFKFNVLVQRFNTMQQYWGRVVREIENGTFRRDVIRAAARFGDNALTGVAKKRAKEMSKLIAAQSKRVVDDMMELGADDLIEDDDELDPPTPPKMEVATSRAHGLVQGDLPLVTTPPAAPSRAVAIAVEDAASRPLAPPSPAPEAAPAQARSGGLRWGSSDPSSSIRTAPVDAKRRVAELAAEMRTARPQDEEAPAFGALDLDFDDGPGSRRAAAPIAPPVAATGRPLPLPTPPARPSSSAQRPAATPPAAASTSGPTAGTFGMLDIPFNADSHAPAPSPSSPGSGIRMGAGRPEPRAAAPAQRVAPAPAPFVASPPRAAALPRSEPQPQPARPQPQQAQAAAAVGADLGEQRLRQIYAKYVDTKRSVNESTAGVTYDKLAATLRAQAEKLRTQHPSKSIDYEVVVKDGKTHLKPVLR